MLLYRAVNEKRDGGYSRTIQKNTPYYYYYFILYAFEPEQKNIILF